MTEPTKADTAVPSAPMPIPSTVTRCNPSYEMRPTTRAPTAPTTASVTCPVARPTESTKSNPTRQRNPPRKVSRDLETLKTLRSVVRFLALFDSRARKVLLVAVPDVFIR